MRSLWHVLRCLLLPQVGLGENLGGKGGPGAAADGNLVEVDFFDQF